MDGILPIYKQAGMTSFQIIAQARKLLRTQKIGHTGTLDPAVEGVLPLCIGSATRVAEYFLEMPKEYLAELTLGIATDTEDQTGKVIQEKSAAHLTQEDIQRTMARFVGTIEQIPPMYSAVHYEGKRLYDLARAGEAVERKPRLAIIYSLTPTDFYGLSTPHPRVEFAVACSKGTYIRTLCADIGKALGVGGHMSKLVRTKSGPFTLNEAVTLDQLAALLAAGKPLPLYPPQQVLPFPIVTVRDGALRAVRSGTTLYPPGILCLPAGLSEGRLVSVTDSDGRQLLAIARAHFRADKQWEFAPVKVFPEQE